ncbi:ribonuclease H-like domain-containing protein [Tanacetum coccineum]
MHYRFSHPGQDILDPAPAIYASQPTTLPSALITMPLQDPTWHMDTGASSYLNFNASNLSTIFDKRLFPSVHVGDGKSIPVTNTCHSIIPSHHRPLHLHNVLVTPNIIKNLISVRQFTRDNNCTIEFDAFGFSMKDYLTRHILLRCDSSGDLYPVTKPSTSPTAFLSTSASTWHQRLGHPVKNGTWLLVPRPASVNMVRSIWLFKHKFLADGTLSRYKARLVANGSSQQLGVDFDESFSLFLSQKKYALQLFERAHMPCRGLQYLIFTRPDLSYAVQQICLYMHDLREPHLAALKRILRYVQGDNLLSWSAKRQHTVSCSSAEAEYRGVANVVAETSWLRNLLRELHSPLSTAILFYCDNVSAVYMFVNHVQHQRTKHIEIDIHFVQDMVTAGQVRVLHVPSRFQYADIFTKGLPSALFEEF